MHLEQTIPVQQIVHTTNKIRIHSVNFRFNEGERYATAMYMLLNENGVAGATKTINLTKEELDSWGSDDMVLVDIIKTKLGFI